MEGDFGLEAAHVPILVWRIGSLGTGGAGKERRSGLSGFERDCSEADLTFLLNTHYTIHSRDGGY